MTDRRDDLLRNMARIGQAFASPQRLRMISLLAHSPKTVERLAELTGQSAAAASAHLKVLRGSGLVEAEKEGRHVRCRLAATSVSTMFLALRDLGEELLPEVREVVAQFQSDPDSLSPLGAKELLRELRAGRVRVLDLRPADEYETARLPDSISLPFAQIREHHGRLPSDLPLLAYCRGPYCVMAFKGVQQLRELGHDVQRLTISVPEWRAAGFPLEND